MTFHLAAYRIENKSTRVVAVGLFYHLFAAENDRDMHWNVRNMDWRTRK